jgi:hypothetical protein
MVFVFDKGVLISTRDRRSDSPDPLETYLKTYGFFDEAQWKHIDFIRTNSSLDLTEILISEQLMDEASLEQTLKSIAQEMAHRGMKLRRGRYHFTATKDTPPGVRGRYHIDVQALLMEAARRLDEEPLLLQALPSQAITFIPGSQSPPADALSATGKRILDLAMAGYPLGRIIRSGQTDSFTVRDLLHDFCEQGFLEAHHPGGDTSATKSTADTGGQKRPALKLRSVALTILVTGGLLAFGGLRWGPIIADGGAELGLAAVTRDHDDDTSQPPWLRQVQRAARDLRLRQIRAELVDALELFHYRHGNYPQNLRELVAFGLLNEPTQRVASELGWTYSLLDGGRGYSLAT